MNDPTSDHGQLHGPPDTESSLRREIEDLRRQLREHQRLLEEAQRAPKLSRPSAGRMLTLAMVAVLVIVALFLAGYLPRTRRESQLAADAKSQAVELPKVNVASAERASPKGELVLPGSIQPVMEAPILARADGYIKLRSADIGDRVAAGRLLVEIEAPELDRQIQQAAAALEQSRAVLEQSAASLEQGKSNAELARVTAVRWSNLAKRGVVSRQENDQYQAQSQSQAANVNALEKAVAAARSNVGAAEASLSRLAQLKSYQQVRAPFDGVITLRNVDTGALVNSGSTLLFRIAQTDTLRAYVNVPQANARDVRPGQTARLTVPDLPGRDFTGLVARTANALDSASRTMLVEVRVPNRDGALLPGMYAEIDLSSQRSNPPLLIPSDALVLRPDGTQAAVVNRDGSVHFQKIEVGRDYGDRIEVLSGLEEAQQVVINPNDSVRDGVKVEPVPIRRPSGPRAGAGK